MPCKYANILGAPGTGVHSIRIFDIAVFDMLLTVIAAYIISKKFKKDFKIVLIILFVLGIIVHRIFCVNTTVGKIVFNEN